MLEIGGEMGLNEVGWVVGWWGGLASDPFGWQGSHRANHSQAAAAAIQERDSDNPAALPSPRTL